ncbi:SDR family oxidoreductase [Ruegeria sediminis]|uniref:SDR family oxidoreductase n=1 Tax=Ruegeria sediminis TaxID=2583820 RepID=A0ABY2WUK2_9RHOB|nr:SDR family oxidoreductase [Ruegeria sediminis]TMV04278.1 SDR family oxidoreductase [Ruegeria sediminis]
MSGEAPQITALITGASSGIGRSFAHAYAARGVNIVAVARRIGPLEALAADLSERYGVKSTVLPMDLSEAEAPQDIFDALRTAGKRVDILVNNAGFGVPGELCEVAWKRHRSCIEVMAVAPVRLAYLFAPSMFERGYGRIINVSSLSALLPPHAGGTLYYPVKSFLYQFSLAFREEMREGGVHVAAVCPGFTETNFQAAAGGTVESVSVPRWLWTSPAQVAEAAIRAVEANKAVVIPGLVNKTVAAAFKLLPAALARRLVR